MRKTLLASIAVLALVLGTTVEARACINEPKTKHEEEQFRSRYRIEKPAPPTGGPTLLTALRGIGVSAAGAAMIAGCVHLAGRRD